MTAFNIIKKLFTIDEPCGYTESDLAYWVEVYGAIPNVLKDYYVKFGKHEALNSTQDCLITPPQFEEYSDPNYLIFYSEDQGVCMWGIKKRDVQKENPPVYENYGEDEWYLTADTVYEFLISMAHLQAVMCMEFSNEEYTDISQAQASEIANRFISKQADSGLYTGVKFYGDYDDTVIVVMNNHERFILMYSSNGEEHFNEIDRIINNILSAY